ncbi:AbfB domain-containing protein [Streptomyces sp. NPDC048392]|uniref:AbfB domain-containing protein n=1 Tax=Streptomyces sp. NPDC048392 TaxID=3365543 RepID=UPI003723D4AB
MVCSDSLGYIDPVSTSSSAAVKQSATFTVVPGLADANCYSIRDSSGHCLRRWHFRVRFDSSNTRGSINAAKSGPRWCCQGFGERDTRGR